MGCIDFLREHFEHGGFSMSRSRDGTTRSTRSRSALVALAEKARRGCPRRRASREDFEDLGAIPHRARGLAPRLEQIPARAESEGGTGDLQPRRGRAGAVHESGGWFLEPLALAPECVRKNSRPISSVRKRLAKNDPAARCAFGRPGAWCRWATWFASRRRSTGRPGVFQSPKS